MKLSQSIIKDLLNGCCKYYFQQKHVDGLKIKPTLAKQKGLYFESELLGNSRDGKFTPLEKKTGGKYQWVIDVDKIISLAKDVFNNSGIKIDNVQKVIETNDYIGHIDFESDLIYDVKFTGESFDRWNKSFQYDLQETMDIQARHYQKLLFEKEGLKKDLVFLIFSEKKWFRGILYPFEDIAIENHDNRIETAKKNISELENPTSLKCSSCELNEICKHRVKKLEVENINDLIFI